MSINEQEAELFINDVLTANLAWAGFAKIKPLYYIRKKEDVEYRVIVSLRSVTGRGIEVWGDLATYIDCIGKIVNEPDVSGPPPASAFVAYWKVGKDLRKGPLIAESLQDCVDIANDIVACVNGDGGKWMESHDSPSKIKQARMSASSQTSIANRDGVDAAILVLEGRRDEAVKFLNERLRALPSRPLGKRIDLERLIRRVEKK